MKEILVDCIRILVAHEQSMCMPSFFAPAKASEGDVCEWRLRMPRRIRAGKLFEKLVRDLTGGLGSALRDLVRSGARPVLQVEFSHPEGVRFETQVFPETMKKLARSGKGIAILLSCLGSDMADGLGIELSPAAVSVLASHDFKILLVGNNR